MNSEVTLLPCSFCNSAAMVRKKGKRVWWIPGHEDKVSCSNDGCGAHFSYWSQAEWNRRTTPPASGEVVNARAEMPDWQTVDKYLGDYARTFPYGPYDLGEYGRITHQREKLRAWLAAQPLAPEGGDAKLIAQQARTIEVLGEIIASQSGTVAACYEGAVRENARIASTDGNDHPPRSERNYVTADELMADIEAERPGFAAECAALREQWAAEAATPPAPAREAVGRVEGYMGLSDGQGHKVYLVGYTDGTLPLGTPLYANPAAGAVVVDEARDAARYRYLRGLVKTSTDERLGDVHGFDEAIDKAIDDALTAAIGGG